MYSMLLAHLGAALIGPFLVRVMGRSAFFLLALVPAASAAWLATIDPRGLAENPLEVSVPGSRPSTSISASAWTR